MEGGYFRARKGVFKFFIGKKIKQIKKLKYNNRPTTCDRGHKHPSKVEKEYCDLLYLRLTHSNCPYTAIYYEKKYSIRCEGHLICTHKPDFTLIYKNGKEVIHEVKGPVTLKLREFKLVKKLFIANYPDIEYKIVMRTGGIFLFM